MNIAFVGLGRMGRELVQHVLGDGHSVTVWNRTPAATESASRGGAVVAQTPAAAVEGADILITALFGPDAVRQVILNGDLPLRSGLLWIDVTTISPEDADEFQATAALRGVEYVHSPVIGSLAPARAKMLGVLVGGSADAVAAALPIVSLWADPERIHTFDRASKAAASKLVANLAVAVSMQGIVEALRLGHGGGLTTEEVLAQLLDKTPLQIIAALKADVIRNNAFNDGQFTVDALAKDTALMVRTANGPLPALTSAAASFESVQAAGFGDSDFSAIARHER